ncbi:hypothetical protein ACHAXT_000820 [Thalassiosira profunda]
MALGRGKRRRTRGQPPRLAAPVTDVLGFDILLECLSYLEVEDVNSACTTCTAWRDRIWQSSSIWEGLLVQKYPSHADLPRGWCTNGREEYIRRMTLMKCQYAPVRSLPGLPVPLQRRTPGKELMERWKPDAIVIVFLVDIFTGRNDFDDDLPVSHSGPVEEKRRLGPQMPFFSNCFRACAPEMRGNISDDALSNLDDEAFTQFTSLLLESDTLAYVLETLELFHDATIANEAASLGPEDVGGLYVEMSYYVEGGNAPKCNPITLLSEHHTFFVEESSVTYRTDVEPCWLADRQDWNAAECVFDKNVALQRGRVLSRQISKYGSVPLPFDPQVELLVSVPGERSTHDWDDEDRVDGEPADSKSVCFVRVGPGFSVGEDYDCDFAGLVVPSLLSLWHDHARQNGRKSLYQSSR